MDKEKCCWWGLGNLLGTSEVSCRVSSMALECLQVKIRPSNGLPREVVRSPILGVFRSCVDVLHSDMV